MVIVSFYTENTPYEFGRTSFENSIRRYNIKYEIVAIKSKGNWKLNCIYRSLFIIDMMNKYNDDILWLDIDAEVIQNPELLYNIPNNIDLAYYANSNEIMLGTSYWKNCRKVRDLLKRWYSSSNADSGLISQHDFASLVFGHTNIVMDLRKTKESIKEDQGKVKGRSSDQFNVMILPEAYCHIYYEKSDEDPVIVHSQFSRRFKNMIIRSDSNSKPRIGIPANTSGWAFSIRAGYIKKYLSEFYNISTISYRDFKNTWSEYDLVYFPTYEVIERFKFNNCCATIGGLVVKTLDESIPVIKNATAISVPNQTWFNIYQSKIKDDEPKLFMIPNGIDCTKFKPSNRPPNVFVVGWAGNVEREVKRFNALQNACDELGFPLIKRTYGANQVPHDNMPEFYNSISCYVNISTTEGSNNCILEAMASGVPIVATSVGNVPEFVSNGIFRVRDDLSNLKEAIVAVRRIIPQDLLLLSRQLANEVHKIYNIEKTMLQYKEMFDYCLNEKQIGREEANGYRTAKVI